MRKFQSYLTEAAPDAETSALRSYVSKALKDQGIKEIGSSRGGYHIRFAIKGDGKAYTSFFSGLGISIKDYSGPIISDKYTTHTLKAIEDITTPGPRPKNIPKGTELYWVNSEISQTASGGQIFANKDLTPDSLSLAGQQLNTIDLITKTSSALKAKYPEGNTAEELIKALNALGREPYLGWYVSLNLSKKKMNIAFDNTKINGLLKSHSFEKLDYEINYGLYFLKEDYKYLDASYDRLIKEADNLEPDVAAKFLSYPIPSAIVEEWEKVK